MIRVGVVDDHVTIAHGVAMLLRTQEDMRVMASAMSPKALAESPHALDVILLDLSLGDGSTVEDNVTVLQRLTNRVIAFTSGEQPHLIREASRAGVSAVVRKSAPTETLFHAIRGVYVGTEIVDSEWAAALDADRAFVNSLLTPRETEVLTLYAGGESAKRVAAMLHIAEDTVVDHVRSIRAKYAQQNRPVKTKVDLFRRAVQDGILNLDD